MPAICRITDDLPGVPQSFSLCQFASGTFALRRSRSLRAQARETGSGIGPKGSRCAVPSGTFAASPLAGRFAPHATRDRFGDWPEGFNDG
jgi:hypothetical protein